MHPPHKSCTPALEAQNFTSGFTRMSSSGLTSLLHMDPNSLRLSLGLSLFSRQTLASSLDNIVFTLQGNNDVAHILLVLDDIAYILQGHGDVAHVLPGLDDVSHILKGLGDIAHTTVGFWCCR